MAAVYSHESLTDSVRNEHPGGDGHAQISELDLFSKPTLQSSIESCYHEDLYPGEGHLARSSVEIAFHAKPGENLIGNRLGPR